MTCAASMPHLPPFCTPKNPTYTCGQLPRPTSSCSSLSGLSQRVQKTQVRTHLQWRLDLPVCVPVISLGHQLSVVVLLLSLYGCCTAVVVVRLLSVLSCAQPLDDTMMDPSSHSNTTRTGPPRERNLLTQHIHASAHVGTRPAHSLQQPAYGADARV